MPFAIRGLGTTIPPTRVCRQESEKLALSVGCPTDDQATWIPNVYAGTGIETRGVWFPQELVRDVLEGTTLTGSVFLPRGTQEDRGPTTSQRMECYVQFAGPLAVDAARKAIERSSLPTSRFTHLVTVSCTGFHAPGVDIELIDKLGLRRDIERTNVGFMGCHGALNGMRVVRSFIESCPRACVLLSAVELCSLHYHYGWEPQKVIANALFADGAAALVAAETHPTRVGWMNTASGSYVFRDSKDAMTWSIGDHGFDMTLSRQVPKLIENELRPWLSTWLDKQQLAISDIRSWAVHPGGPRILDAVERALHLDGDALRTSREILSEFGNMSSPTILFIIERMIEQNASRPCVALGFGPGLTVEAALFR